MVIANAAAFVPQCVLGLLSPPLAAAGVLFPTLPGEIASMLWLTCGPPRRDAVPLPGLATRRLLLVCLILPFCIACSESQGSLDGALRVRPQRAIGDTLQWLIEGAPTDERLVRPVADVLIPALDSAGDEPLARVRSVIGMRDGATIVYDASYERLALFDRGGRFVRYVGRSGGGPGEYRTLYGATALPDDRTVAWDGGGARLNFYGPDGSFERSWPVMSTGASSADGILSDAAGNIYLRATLRFDPAAPEQTVSGLLRWDSLGVPDTIVFPRWNAPSPPLLARMPSGMTVLGGSVPYLARDHHRPTGNGILVTGPGDPYVFTLLARGGVRPVRFTRSHVPVAVPTAERHTLRARLEGEMRGIEPSWAWNGPAIPATKPAYRSIDVDREGRIWILLSAPTLDAPQREMPVYDVYASDGAPIARVELPRGARFASANGAFLWMVRLDSLDVPVVERAPLTLPAPVTVRR